MKKSFYHSRSAVPISTALPDREIMKNLVYAPWEQVKKAQITRFLALGFASGVNILVIKAFLIFVPQEMVPAPSQSNPIINLHRSFIQSPSTMPTELYLDDVISEIFNWDREDVYSFLLHEAYTPNFPKASTPQPKIIDIAWSPSTLLHPRRCLAALLTSVGAVEVTAQFDRGWFAIGSISTAWAAYCEPEYRRELELGVSTLNRTFLEAQLNRLITTTIAWSPCYESSGQPSFAFLVTAQRNSELVLWRLNRNSNNDLRTTLKIDFELILNKKLIKANVKISSLLWVSLDERNCLIIVGYYTGPVGVLQLQNCNEKPKFSSYSTCFEDEDWISVDSIHVLRQTDKWLELVVIKGMHLLALVVDIHGKMISTKFITSPGFSITGVSIMSSDMVLITTQDGQLCEVKKSPDQQQLICTPLKSDLVKNQLQYLGLAASPNRTLFTLVTSPTVLYDHLVNREPSSIFFFSLLNNNSSLFNPLEIIFQDGQSLMKCWDCLELIKINFLKFNEKPSIVSRLCGEFESMTAHKLRLAHWIMTISETARRKNSSGEIPQLTEEIEQSRNYIFLHSACNYLELLLATVQLTKLQKLSAYLLKTQLEVWLAGEEDEVETALSHRVQRILEISSALEPSKPERCNFCNELVLEPWSTSCPTGHKLPRCGITRLQVTGAMFRSCKVCQELFHPSLDEERLVSEVVCPYCDLPAGFNNESVDEAFKVPPKYLSARLTSEIKEAKGNKNKDDEETNLNEE